MKYTFRLYRGKSYSSYGYSFYCSVNAAKKAFYKMHSITIDQYNECQDEFTIKIVWNNK